MGLFGLGAAPVVQAGADGAKTAVGAAITPDGKMEENVLLDRLQKLGYNEVQINLIKNAMQGRGPAIEAGAREYTTGIGVESEKARQSFYQNNMTSFLQLTADQQRKASDAVLNLSMELNRQTLETEKLKLAAKMTPYEMAGKFAGFVYAVGAILESVSPGSGRQLMDQSNSMIKDVNSQINQLQISPPDAAAYQKGYMQVGNVISGMKYDISGMDKVEAKRTGDKIGPDGKIVSTNELQNRAKDSSLNPAAAGSGIPTHMSKPKAADPTDVPMSNSKGSVGGKVSSKAADPTDVPVSAPARSVAAGMAASAAELTAVLKRLGINDQNTKSIVEGALKADIGPGSNSKLLDTAKEKDTLLHSKVIEGLPQAQRTEVIKALKLEPTPS